ncbi:DUF1080 domain-containing protein [candidate division KSB1 bacterium]|nr:DUF1080 domain-containing protein [candidate division KSB1 bacterium]
MRGFFLSLILAMLGIFQISWAADPVMGDWEGTYQEHTGLQGVLQVQIVAEANQTYRALIQMDNDEHKFVLLGNQQENKTVFAGNLELGAEQGGRVAITAEIFDGKFTGNFEGPNHTGTFELKKINRQSPTLEAKPPAGAVILFEGQNVAAWQQVDGTPALWKIVPGGAMEVMQGSIISRQTFGDFKLHLEFRTPFMPEAQGQARGNSGVYLHGRYEVQVLDSYGQEPADDLCGGIYKVAVPQKNAVFPPLTWQTYDITFYAPKFDAQGNKVSPAEITVLHNGILIHDRVAVNSPTGGAAKEQEATTGRIMLQDHGNPVQYRNIWILPL